MLMLLSLYGLASAAPVEDAQVLIQAQLHPAVATSTWPDCQQNDVRIRSGAGALDADLTDYGATAGCSHDDCTDSDEMSLADPAACALVCATTTNCKYWTWGYEASKKKCWLRTSDAEKTTIPAEAEGFISGSAACRPAADFSAIHDDPVTGEMISFLGQECPSGKAELNPNGKDFLLLGQTEGEKPKPYFYNKDVQLWLYYDTNCNGKEGEEGWLPHWVITKKPPRLDHTHDRDGDGICEAVAYTSIEGDALGPVSSGWQVDCGGEGLNTTTLPMDILRHGLLAQFFKVSADSLDTFVPTDEGPTLVRVDPRIDYWVTPNAWKGLADEFTGSYYAKWTGYLKIVEAGDYYFTIGTSDIAYLEWYHPDSKTWATYKHNGQGTFSYSSTDDHTPETVRALTSGFHKFRIRYWRKYDSAHGLVFKYNGPDSNNTRKVVPTKALLVQPPGCTASSQTGEPICEEGFLIANDQTCTVINALACPECYVADPVTCESPNPIAPVCRKSEECEKKEAEGEQKEKAEAAEKANSEAEQKDKADAEAEAEQKAKAEATTTPGPQPPIVGNSIARWR